MDWQTRMNTAIAFIEDHLETELNWEDVAKAANCSLFHFFRMFEVITGLTAGDYVRRRRLSKAALELSGGDVKIIDLALKYGYASPEAFSKAFRRVFGCTPSETRNPGVHLKTYPPLTFNIRIRGETAIKFQVVSHPPFTFWGISQRTSTKNHYHIKAVPDFWEKCLKDGSLARLRTCSKGQGIYGVCADFNELREDFSYCLAVKQDPSLDEIPAEYSKVEIPAATWGIFECTGPVPLAIQSTCQRIYTEWFPDSGWEHAGLADFEFYPTPDTEAPDYYSEIWMPLRRAGSRPMRNTRHCGLP
jgi:AraC family transcriptional regulator